MPVSIHRGPVFPTALLPTQQNLKQSSGRDWACQPTQPGEKMVWKVFSMDYTSAKAVISPLQPRAGAEASRMLQGWGLKGLQMLNAPIGRAGWSINSHIL